MTTGRLQKAIKRTSRLKELQFLQLRQMDLDFIIIPCVSGLRLYRTT